jgi:hypothetical protein
MFVVLRFHVRRSTFFGFLQELFESVAMRGEE